MLWHVFLIKESLRTFWECKNREEAEQYFKNGIFWAAHSRLKVVIGIAKTIKGHWDGILDYFESRIINGNLEGIKSNAQLIKRNASGYRETQYFINIIYLKIGKLDFKLPTWSSEEPTMAMRVSKVWNTGDKNKYLMVWNKMEHYKKCC
jgi:transposase